MKALQIIRSAYRCTVEEQDDPVIWFAQVLRSAEEGEVDILLQGNAVNYAASGQGGALTLGAWQQKYPAKVDQDLQQAMGSGATVYAIAEDLAERGVPANQLIDGLKQLSRQELPNLFAEYEQVWCW